MHSTPPPVFMARCSVEPLKPKTLEEDKDFSYCQGMLEEEMLNL
jgi:hypothetical protein